MRAKAGRAVLKLLAVLQVSEHGGRINTLRLVMIINTLLLGTAILLYIMRGRPLG